MVTLMYKCVSRCMLNIKRYVARRRNFAFMLLYTFVSTLSAFSSVFGSVSVPLPLLICYFRVFRAAAAAAAAYIFAVIPSVRVTLCSSLSNILSF